MAAWVRASLFPLIRSITALRRSLKPRNVGPNPTVWIMRTMICTECDLNPDKYVCYHAFNLPDVSEPGFYRSVGSFNAFFNSGKKGRNWTKHKLYHQMDDISLGWHKKCYINRDHQTQRYLGVLQVHRIRLQKKEVYGIALFVRICKERPIGGSKGSPSLSC